MLFRERFEKRFGHRGYVLDDLLRVRPGPSVRTVDFGELMDVLKSSDASLLEKNDWMFNDLDDAKYLNMHNPASGKTVANTGNVVSYSSYPRSGNSFLRKYL